MNYIIFGSGGMAKETIARMDPKSILCVIADAPFNNPAYTFPVVPRLPELPDSVEFIMAVADIALKMRWAAEMPDRWGTFIDPTAVVSPYAKIGKGCVISAFASICGDAIIGDFVHMNVMSVASHDGVIGDFSTLSPQTECTGGTRVGKGCFLGVGSYLTPGVSIANWVKVSAGAVVRKNVTHACTVYGDPAKERVK